MALLQQLTRWHVPLVIAFCSHATWTCRWPCPTWTCPSSFCLKGWLSQGRGHRTQLDPCVITLQCSSPSCPCLLCGRMSPFLCLIYPKTAVKSLGHSSPCPVSFKRSHYLCHTEFLLESVIKEADRRLRSSADCKQETISLQSWDMAPVLSTWVGWGKELLNQGNRTLSTWQSQEWIQ